MASSGLPAALAVAALLVAGCSSTSTTDTRSAPTGSCPVSPLEVVVTVDQWGDVVDSLAGACGQVTTIIGGSAGDPHDYEPTPADSAAFTSADLVVLNGLDYDHWADDALDTLSTKPSIVDAGDVVGLSSGDNPHLWYSPTYVRQVADAVTAELQQLAPDASAYFRSLADEWSRSMQPYDDAIAALNRQHAGAPYAATESVFDYMAAAAGLDDRTPSGYRTAAANESEPAPGDISSFEDLLRSRQIDVLIYNTQTEGNVTAQLRDQAEAAGVPVVEVTETVPPGAPSFVDWQLGQLQALSEALAS